MILFTDPFGWRLLGLAALLALLALLRWRRRTVALSAWFLLRVLAERLAVATPGRRLLRAASLALAAAALAALATAGFRPVRLGVTAPVRALLVVDCSPSLGVREGERERADRLRREVARFLDALQPEDTLFAVVAGPRPSVSPALRGAAGARRWLGEVVPRDAAADIPGAVSQAAAIAAREAPAPVVVVTDTPARWTAAPGWERLAGARPAFVSFGGPVANAGITAFELRRARGGEGRYDLWLKAERHGPGTAAATVSVANNGRTVATVARTLRPGAAEEVLLRGLPLEEGRVEVLLAPPDGWAPDNRVLAGIAARGAVRVRLAGAASRFLRDALAANPEVDLEAAPADAALPAPPGTVVVYDGVVPPGELPERALFVLPNRPLEGLAPSAFLPPPDRIEGDAADPVLRGFDLRHLAVRGRLSFEGGGGSWREVLLGDGRPLLLLGEDPRRRWAVLGFDPARTSFVYTASWPVLVANLLSWITALAPGERTSFTAAEEIRLPALSAGGAVLLPGGERVELPGEPTAAPFPRAGRAGSYRVSGRGGEPLGEFFVNVTDPAVTAAVAGAGGGEGGGLPPGLVRPPIRRDLTPWLALAAVALLALESALRPRAASARR